MSADADDPDPLLSVAGKISSGVPVDWKELQDQIATPDQVAIAEELRSLERYARANEEVPACWGRFHIIEQIGVGTFGVVYRAVDPTFQIEMALKVTRPRHPELPSEQEKALNEARRLVKVKHPNVVRAFGAERVGDEVGLSMELVRGKTLEEIVRRQAPFSATEATIIGIDLCRALAAVHGAGILHGDIKAHNLMREEGGRTVLMDFGTGRDLKREPSSPGADFAGTPLYLAPEVFAGSSRTMASEIYSVGVLLYFLVTGSYPVQGDTRTAIGQLHDQQGARKPLRDVRPDLPDPFIRVVERALAENPVQRFESAGALETALVQLLPARDSRPVPSPAPTATLKVLLTVFALLVLAIGALTVDRLRGPSPPEVGNLEPGVIAAQVVEKASSAPLSNSDASSEYRIDAAFYREQTGSIERLTPGTRVSPEETISLQVEISAPVYVYVVNEDESGESYLLFPLPGLELSNPLQPGQRHRLPGMWNGEAISWQVTSAGRKEHFFIVASPARSPAFEEMFATLPRPGFGKPAVKLSLDGIGLLRSVGGLAASPSQGDRQLRLLPEFSTPLGSSEERVRGVWIRQATFENPSRR
jgi:eukaryotic-like serine/threonine-protein kinase